MNDPIKNLLDKILIIQQDNYSVCDIVFKKAKRWEYNGNKILTEEKYNGSILKSYLEINGLYSEVNLKKLLDITQEYNKNNNFPIPSDNELVLHLRLGDFVEYTGILTKPYIKLIRQYINNKNINKITIVTAFSYGTWTKETLHLKPNDISLFKCTQETQKINIRKMKKLIKRIKNNFSNIEVDIMSNLDIDKDFCYCVNSKHFIKDVGGFSDLMMKLNKLRKLELKKI